MVILTPPPTPGHSATFAAVASSKWQAAALLKSINNFLLRAKKKLGRSNGSLKPRLLRPKQFLATISTKAISFRRKKKEEDETEARDFGEGGLWRQKILMGDRCEPLDFPGVIYYDSNGNRLSQLPVRSPRASPLPTYLLKSAEVK